MYIHTLNSGLGWKPELIETLSITEIYSYMIYGDICQSTVCVLENANCEIYYDESEYL